MLDPVEANDPATNDKIFRHKRLSEHLDHVKKQFHLCRSSKTDPMECDKFYREMVKISAALKQEIDTIDEFGRNVQNPSKIQNQEIPNDPKMSLWPADPTLQPLSEMKQEDKMLQKISHLAPITRFHEDMENANVWNEKLPNIQQEYPKPPIHTQSASKAATFRDNEKIIPLKNQNFGNFFGNHKKTIPTTIFYSMEFLKKI